MESLARPMTHVRCLVHSRRTRILGVRNLTSTARTALPRLRPGAAIRTTTIEPHLPHPITPTANSKKVEVEVPKEIARSVKDEEKVVPRKENKQRVPEPSPTLLTLQPQTLHAYTTSPVPTPVQMTHSNAFFTAEPTHLWTGAYFRQFPSSFHPEVAFLGRSNVGKSSLLNALFNRPRARTAHVSKKPGRTRTMNAFGVGPERLDIAKETERWKSLGRGGLVVVDMPGYGKGSREVWGQEIMKYLEKRKQLRKTFLLVDVEHGLKKTDVQLLHHLRKEGIQHQIILSKVDKILYPNPKPPSPQKLHNCLTKLRNTIEEIKAEIQQPNADILCVSAEKDLFMQGMPKAGRLGIDAVRWAVLRACGLDCDEQGRKREYETFAAAKEVEEATDTPSRDIEADDEDVHNVEKGWGKTAAKVIEKEEEFTRYAPMS